MKYCVFWTLFLCNSRHFLTLFWLLSHITNIWFMEFSSRCFKKHFWSRKGAAKMFQISIAFCFILLVSVVILRLSKLLSFFTMDFDFTRLFFDFFLCFYFVLFWLSFVLGGDIENESQPPSEYVAGDVPEPAVSMLLKMEQMNTWAFTASVNWMIWP